MSIVSPPHTSKPTIAMPPEFTLDDSTASDPWLPAPEDLSEYALFLLLERHRTTKLRELYRGRRPAAVGTPRAPPPDDPLPPWPPRFRCLDLSGRRVLVELTRRRRRRYLGGRPANEQWRALDLVTKTFLEDAVVVLRRMCEHDPAATYAPLSSPLPLACTTPRFTPSTAVTPPSSPLTLPLAVTTEDAGPSTLPWAEETEDAGPSQDSHHTARGDHVTMSDNEILSLWNQAEPSVDTIDLNAFLGNDAKEEKDAHRK